MWKLTGRVKQASRVLYLLIRADGNKSGGPHPRPVIALCPEDELVPVVIRRMDNAVAPVKIRLEDGALGRGGREEQLCDHVLGGLRSQLLLAMCSCPCRQRCGPVILGTRLPDETSCRGN